MRFIHLSIFTLFVLILETSGFALNKVTKRHELCGIESYKSKADPACGVELYLDLRGEECGVEHYNSRADASKCGSRVFCIPEENRCDTVPKICEHPSFGIKTYKSCRSPLHPVESYKTCSLIEFGVELYKECSFYKTPEEIDAYIDATYSSLSINSILLPAKQADLYSSFRQEASFICLIEKYKDLEGFDVVFDDLTKKFFDSFAYDYTSSSVTCADAANENRNWKITAGALDCKNFDINSIRSLKQPDGMNSAVFNRFKSTCSSKLTYDFVVNWFTDKATEVSQLLDDIVARTDAARKVQLEELKKSVIESK